MSLYIWYTYPFMYSKQTLLFPGRYLSEEQLMLECGITNSIHRQKLRHSILSKFCVWCCNIYA